MYSTLANVSDVVILMARSYEAELDVVVRAGEVIYTRRDTFCLPPPFSGT